MPVRRRVYLGTLPLLVWERIQTELSGPIKDKVFIIFWPKNSTSNISDRCSLIHGARVVFLTLGSITVLGQSRSLLGWSRPVHCRMFSNIPGLYPLTPPVYENQKKSFQTLPNVPWGVISAMFENKCLKTIQKLYPGVVYVCQLPLHSKSCVQSLVGLEPKEEWGSMCIWIFLTPFQVLA